MVVSPSSPPCRPMHMEANRVQSYGDFLNPAREEEYFFFKVTGNMLPKTQTPYSQGGCSAKGGCFFFVFLCNFHK